MSPRLPFLVLVGLVGGSIVIGSAQGSRPTLVTAPRPVAGLTAPAVRPAAAGATWYCAGGTAQDGGLADHRVIVANPTDGEATGTLTVFPGRLELAGTTTEPAASDRTPTTEAFAVAARSRATFRLADMRSAPVAAALVELDRGGLAVEHQVVGANGGDVAPCASAAASSWHFAWGSTSRDAREVLVLFNPFASDIAVDASFATEAGVREPLGWQALIVPARGVVGIDVGQDVTRRDQVAATIRARGGGRLIVDRLQVFDGRAGRRGLSLSLGQPDPTEIALFPGGRVGAHTGERIVLYNPDDDTAEVEVHVQTPGTDRAPVQPFEMVVRPGRYEVLDYAAEDRLPRDVDHVTVVRSRNGVPVVAERVQNAGSQLSAAPGALFRASTWVFPAVQAAGAQPPSFTVVNPDADHPARVSVDLYAEGRRIPRPELQQLDVPAGGRITVPVPMPLPAGAGSAAPAATAGSPGSRGASVVVRSDRAVVAARDGRGDGVVRAGGPGIPVGDHLDPPL